MFRTEMAKAFNRPTLNSVAAEHQMVDLMGREWLPFGDPLSSADRFVICRTVARDGYDSSGVLESRDTLFPSSRVPFVAGDLILSVRARTLGTRSIFAVTPKCRSLSCECDRHLHNCPRRGIASNNLDGRHEHGHV
jgi:hypothetical protein